MEKTYIIANWKMNPQTIEEAARLFGTVANGVKNLKDVDVVICPPFVYLPLLMGASSFARQKASYGGFPVALGVGGQDCFWEHRGAFTGEISPLMLKNLGCGYVIIGHSERKNYLGETNDIINKKLRAALKVKLTPIVCIGEKRKTSVNNRSELKEQLDGILQGVEKQEVLKIILVYEPEWAISAAKGVQSATPQRVAESLDLMRSILGDMFGREIGEKMQILYGGSVSSGNIKECIKEGGAQGALVGSASLDAKEFISLVKNARIR